MESFPEMTNRVTTLVRATGIEDSGRMSGGAGTERPDPEVPERARRRTFTAKYKLEMLSAYDAALNMDEGMSIALYGRGVIEARLGKKAESARDIGAAVKVRPTIAATFKSMGVETP